MASFSAFGDDFLSIALIVLHCLEGSALWSSVSMFFPMFVCSTGDLGVHLLQCGRGVISESEVVSCSHPFPYFCWNRLCCINTVSSIGYML